jgi:hypothetical protein
MNEILNRIFGLGGEEQSLGFGSPDAQVGFVHPLAGWIIAIVIGVIVLAVWWSYRSVPGVRAARIALGALRVIAMSILFIMALGPMIEQTTIRTEQDWALVLLDRSGSLGTRDAPGGGLSAGTLGSRDDQILEMLSNAGDEWENLAQQKQVVWVGFGDIATTLATGSVPSIELITPANGRSTNLGGAIRSALDNASARPISAIVIASDGRSFDAVDPELINTIKSSQIPIFAVPLGSDEPVRDLGIAQVEYPQAVFADDLVPIRVLLTSASINKEDLANDVMHVQLVDHATGEVIDSIEITPENLGLGLVDSDAQHEWITLTHKPTESGDREFEVRVGSKAASGDVDLNTSNNQSSVSIGVVDRPMRILYIDGYPRWEHRYLKNLLLRERSILSSSMLLASSRRYVQEGDELISALPSTLEDWEPFDVVILGDVRPELFSDQQLESLLEHVTAHGAGVLWIAGPSSTPTSWLDSPLAALLPMHSDAGGSQGIIRSWDSPVTMRSTPEAVRLGVLGLNDERTGWFDRLSDPATGWSKLQWALNLDETSFKPGVSVLAMAKSTIEAEESPIVTAMRYGAGRTVFVGTDEIWRWRYGRGEDLSERFWLPMIRSLGRGTVDRRSAPASLSVSPANPIPGKPTQITLRLFDQSRIDSMPDEVRVQLRSESDVDEPTEVTLRGSGDIRIGTWIPDQPGSFAASLTGFDLEMTQIVSRARVLDESDEQRVLDTDHGLLTDLANQTGGKIVQPDAFGTLPELMPNRTRTVVSPPKQASLWDRPIVLIVLVVLLTGEWIGRRVLRLA